jgi:outer membrane protein assembly factor BamA
MRFRQFGIALMVIGLVAAAPSPIVTRVIIAGDPVVPVPTLYAHLTIRPGMRYSDAIREKDVKSVRDFYEARHLELGNFEGGIDPASVDAKSDSATVKYVVYVARVAAVRIVGSTDANEAVARKLLQVRPGMILNTELVKADYDRLRATGKFKKVDVNVVQGLSPSKPQDITLVWALGQ